MLKAITTITCLTIVILYCILLLLTYPYVCWIKYRPSDIITDFEPSQDAVVIPRSDRICSKNSQLNLMPMPSDIILSSRMKFIHLPSKVRIQTKYSHEFPVSFISSNASFILSIDSRSNIEEPKHFYPKLGIDESYELNITSAHRASLSAKTYAGIIRGLSTFQQLQNEDQLPIPLSISDRPRFPWRGLMLDVSRHFIPYPILLQTIDLMQLVKLNVLHLHLSDDQAFRFQSKQYPHLHDSHQFYTQIQMKNLVEHARQRAIRVIPEFDVPAHTASWFVGYPHLASTRKDSYDLIRTWGVHNATMDVTREETYEFLEKFFAEVTQIFPDEYFHIGGDECVPFEWMESERIRMFIDDHQLVDHQGLQGYFTKRVEKILTKLNRKFYGFVFDHLFVNLLFFLGKMVGWDEISTSNLSRQSIIQSWRNKISLIEAIQQGYSGILSHGFYLDHMASSAYHYQNDLQVDMILNEIEQKRFLGGEACLWTEYIDGHMVHSRLWPRTAAIAERFWSVASDEIECMHDRLDNLNRKVFHSNDRQYLNDLARLTKNSQALKLLADLCEPLGLHGRNRQLNYTSRTKLNRFVDIIRPDSEQTRRLIRNMNISSLYSIFMSWIENHFSISTNDSDIIQLSENLYQLADIGIHLVKIFEDNPQQRPIISSRWFYYQKSLFNQLEYQVPEIRLAGVDVLKALLHQCEPCSFDLINLSLILFFPLIVIVVQRVSYIRRRLLLPCLNFCYNSCARC